MDLTTIPTAELREMYQLIPGELKRREAQEKTDTLNELRAVAKARGYSIEELLGKEAAKVKLPATGGKVKVKYRHPENGDLEWTGRGRKPKWVEAWLAEGKAIESLLV